MAGITSALETANPYVAAAGIGLGLVGTIGNLFGAHKANKRLGQLLSSDPTYTANPIAAQRLGLASTLLNARMPGAANVERNIYGTQANTLANVDRNATNGSQALAVAAGVQGQTDQAFQNEGLQEAQDYQRRYSNLVGAQEGEIQEGDKVHQDKVRQFQDKASILGAQTQNNANAWQSLTNFGYGAANLGIMSGMKYPTGYGYTPPAK